VKSTKTLISALAMVATAGMVVADPDDDQLTVNGEIEIITEAAAPAHTENLSKVYSGWRFRSDETQAMQMDDFDNPAMIFVEAAAETWETEEGTEGKSCSSCHNDVESMRGVRAVYPKWNETAGEVRTLEMQVNDCRENQMGAEPLKYTGGDMAAMVGLISSVSRGMPVDVAIDGPVQSMWEQGKELYYTCGPSEPRPDQWLPGVSSEEHQAEHGPCPLQRLRARHPRRNLQARLGRVRRA